MSIRGRKLILAAAVLLIAVIIVFGIKQRSVYKEITVEAGTEVSVQDFLRNKKKAAEFVNPSFQTDAIGDYEVEIKVGSKTKTSTLHVIDTNKPEVTTHDYVASLGQPVTPEDFIESAVDGTHLTYSFLFNEPDTNSLEAQTVTICVTDEAKNATTVSANMTVRPLRMELKVEAGSRLPDATSFLAAENTGDVCTYTDTGMANVNKAGYYEVVINYNGTDYTAFLSVTDMTPPELSVKSEVRLCYGQKINLSDFVESVKDYSDYTLSGISDMPEDTSAIASSEQQRFSYTVVATDVYGNRSSAETTVILNPDKLAPVISGVYDIYHYIGESVSYKKGITVTDNVDESVELVIDNSQVDLNTPGTYWVYYSAVDKAGNKATASCYMNVAVKEHTEDEVNALADEVLAKIINDDMTTYDKLSAIYKWVQSNVGYVNHSEKNDQIKAAYEGLKNHAGDCFVFAMTTKYLLTRAGIPNIDIKKVYIEGASAHYWNLVDYGEGWYHYDTTPRKDKTVFFLWTDADLKKYSESHKNSHKYDPSLYPTIN